MQHITIIGNLTKDAELRTTSRQGVKSEFVSFTVACNEQRGDEKATTFFEVTSAKTGVFDYLKKGQKVCVIGNFRFNKTKDANGKEYDHLNIAAYGLELAGSLPAKKEEDLPEA